jgi:pimeloyl-ACP methyl ester carboxylesterase/class 3 adenylate cyclase
MVRGVTQYVKSKAGYIAYQVFGEGPLDILFITNWGTNLEVMWEEPSASHFFGRLAAFGRVICFDKRGTGVSDPVPLTQLPSLEDWMDDAREVLDAVGSEKAALIGDTEGGPMAILFAATYPDRISALILVNTFARLLRDEDYPQGMPESVALSYRGLFEKNWGNGSFVFLTAPEAAKDERFRQWVARYQRLAMPPGAATLYYGWVQRLDVRTALPGISMPALVIQRSDNQYYRVGHGRYLAKTIPGAKYVELPGTDSYPFHVGGVDQVLDEIQEFLTGVRAVPEPNRVLATIMFTDIANSTEHAASMGDAHWLEVLQAHDTLVRQRLDQYRGREIRSTGDGFLLIFDGPVRAITMAMTIVDEVRNIGLEIRVGLHTGLVEVNDQEIGGIAIHIANRVMDQAPSGDVFVSRTVKDLVAGSGFHFESRGEYKLKGVPDEWSLFSVQTAVSPSSLGLGPTFF